MNDIRYYRLEDDRFNAGKKAGWPPKRHLKLSPVLL